MNILAKDKPKLGGLLEKRFIQRELQDEAKDIDAEMIKEMVSFSGDTRGGRSFSVINTTLLYRHKKKHRFIDMKKRQTKSGVIRKKSYAIHNRILYGHINNIITRTKFGFTDDVKEQMKKMDGTKI